MSIARRAVVPLLSLALSSAAAQPAAASESEASAFQAIAGVDRDLDRVAEGSEPELLPAPAPRIREGGAPAAVSPKSAADPGKPFQEMIGDLITTARRRNEMVQSTPAAVSAFGTDQLAVREVRRLTDLDGLVPNLAIDNALGAAASGRLTIRGVSQFETSTSFDPAVGLYVDGAYIPRAQGQIGPLFDIERVEVVRGPQGTLFGKNTIGGAINVITRRPDFELGGDASIRVGNLGRFDTRATLNLPLISERAAARITVASSYDDGYQNNRFLDERLGTDRLLGTRAELLVLPTNDIEVLLTGQFTREDRRPQASKCVSTTSIPSSRVSELLGSDIIERSRESCLEDSARSDLKVASDVSTDDDFRVMNLTSQVSWEVNDALVLRSITAYRDQDYDVQQDLDATPLALAQSFFDSGGIQARSYSQELQLSGRTRSDRLFYVVGLFAFGEQIDDDVPGGASLLAEQLQNEGNTLLPIVREDRDENNRSYAAYGSLTYAITERLSATAGLRRTVERRRIHKQDIALTVGQLPQVRPGGTVFDFERSSRFDDFSPSASLSYAVTPDILSYASYSTGFRSGGFNGRANFLNPDIGEIDPEKLTTYEIGFKSSFFDSRLVLNAATFYSIFEDIQRPLLGADVNGLIATVVTNAAEARLRGAEIELAALPIPGVRLDASLGAFRGRYTDFDSVDDPNIDDARLPGQPNYLMSFAASYQLPIGALGVLSTRVQWTHRGTQGNDPQDSPSIRSGKYGLMDARMALQLPDGKTELSLFGSNLLDREYFNNGIDATETAGRAIRFQGQPRRYGIEVRREF